MAKIYSMPNQKEWDAVDAMGYEDFDARQKAEDALLAKIPKDRLIHFGVADGSAMYYVYSLKPLVICHVPYCDGYRANRLIEKALNVKEVKRILARKGFGGVGGAMD